MTTSLSQTVFSPWLTPVRLASTSNISGTYYNGPNNNGVGATLTIAASSLTVDSVAAAVGDRILLQTQTNTYEQGIYIVKSIGSTVVLERAADQQSLEQLKAGENCAVGAGSVNAGNFYTLVEPLPSAIGVDAIVFNADPSAGGVTFSGSASTANALVVFSDTAGNIKAASTASTFSQALTVAGALTSTAGPITSGSSGDAGSFISFPATASNGTFIFEALDAGGAFNTTVRNSAMGQSSVISIPDPGQATAEFILSDNAGIQHITSGDLNVDAGSIISGLAAGGFAGSYIGYSTTASLGSLRLLTVDNAGDFAVTISNASHGQASVVSIPDGGQATSEFIIADSAGTQHITSGGLQVDAGLLSSGLAAGGFIGGLDAYPTAASSGILSLRAVTNAGGDFDTTISNAASIGQDQIISIPDSGAATANFLLDTGTSNILPMQQFVGISNVLSFGTGTWTVTRIAQGNYVSRHTQGDETSIIAVDITPAIRTAASKGFRLNSFDYIYSITTLAMDAHSLTLDRIEYADNVAVSVNTIAITGSLATATQANPYVTNIVVDSPAFDITADSKYVIEITANNAATTDYDFYGIMLRFSQTIG